MPIYGIWVLQDFKSLNSSHSANMRYTNISKITAEYMPGALVEALVTVQHRSRSRSMCSRRSTVAAVGRGGEKEEEEQQ